MNHRKAIILRKMAVQEWTKRGRERSGIPFHRLYRAIKKGYLKLNSKQRALIQPPKV